MLIQIEVAYATPSKQKIISLEISEGSSAWDAIIHSKISFFFPEIDLEQCSIGVFSKIVERKYILRNGDRVEIYRPLLVDPKDARRQRAFKGK
jgi:putative ubiquitin-RnfH superfamily antitoxin RatB of RatAB toxin-antitoxin module